MSLSRDPEKWKETQRKGVRRYRERVKREVLAGERDWNSLDGARKTRPAEETERIYGPPERRAWMKEQPCLICGSVPCDSAHVPDPWGPSGMSRKPDARWTVPLCSGPGGHHAEQHGLNSGIRTMEEKHSIDFIKAARETHQRWLEHVAETGEE